jgi:hypothetical protein
MKENIQRKTLVVNKSTTPLMISSTKQMLLLCLFGRKREDMKEMGTQQQAELYCHMPS